MGRKPSPLKDHCGQCRSRATCRVTCSKVEKQLTQATEDPRKKRLHIVYQADLARRDGEYYNNRIYGAQGT